MILLTTSVKAANKKTIVYFGDYNQDGCVDNVDYFALRIILMSNAYKQDKTIKEPQRTIEDIDKDGKVTYTDLSHLTKIINGKEPKKAILLLGDVNYDLKVDSEDASLILKYSVKKDKPSESMKFLADINEDGKIDSDDARLASRMATGQEKLKFVEKGYKLKFIGNNGTMPVYKKVNVNGKEVFKKTRTLKKNEIVVIEEINSDFLNNNRLKIKSNEYILYKQSNFKIAK